MIRKLTHFDQPMISQEPETNAPQQTAVPVTSQLGIAGNTDRFESTNPIPTDYSKFGIQQQPGSTAPQVVTSRETVDASSMFDLIQQPLPSPFDAHFEKGYAARGIHLAGEKVNLKANVNSHAHI